MTTHEMLELIPVLLRQRRGGLVEIRSIEPHEGDWLEVRFANGKSLAITVEEFC